MIYLFFCLIAHLVSAQDTATVSNNIEVSLEKTTFITLHGNLVGVDFGGNVTNKTDTKADILYAIDEDNATIKLKALRKFSKASNLSIMVADTIYQYNIVYKEEPKTAYNLDFTTRPSNEQLIVGEPPTIAEQKIDPSINKEKELLTVKEKLKLAPSNIKVGDYKKSIYVELKKMYRHENQFVYAFLVHNLLVKRQCHLIEAKVVLKQKGVTTDFPMSFDTTLTTKINADNKVWITATSKIIEPLLGEDQLKFSFLGYTIKKEKITDEVKFDFILSPQEFKNIEALNPPKPKPKIHWANN